MLNFANGYSFALESNPNTPGETYNLKNLPPKMQFKTLALLFALTAVGAAQDIESDDFPQACQDTCRDAVSLSQHCDDTTEHDDQERDCVCKGKNAESLLNNCAACSKDNGKDKPDSGKFLLPSLQETTSLTSPIKQTSPSS